MEIKAKLENATNEQRMDFIVQYNHILGYEIEEQEDCLIAWGLTEEEQQTEHAQQRNQEIDDKIKQLQLLAIPEILNNHTANIETYRQIIESLEKARV